MARSLSRRLGRAACSAALGWSLVVAPGTASLGPAGAAEAAWGEPGALLRRAIAAYAAGDADAAEQLLLRVAEGHPVVADYAELLRLRWRVEAGRFAEALELQAALERLDSPLRAEIYTLLGRAHHELGNRAAARTAWEIAAAESRHADRLAFLHFAIGSSLEQSGEAEAAAEAYLRVWTSYPLNPEAAQAAERLDALDRARGAKHRSGEQLRRRGDSLFRLRHNEEALEAYDAALASGDLGRGERRRAERQRAQTLFRLRRYREAARAFDALPDDDETRIGYGRSLARAGQVLRGAEELERVGRRAGRSQSLRARLLAALLYDDEGEAARADALYRELVGTTHANSYARAALWRLGWAAYREGRYDEAVAQLELLDRADPDPISGLRARYWRARSLERADRAADADREYAALAREFPLSYYGWRASARAAGSGPGAEPPGGVAAGTRGLSGSELARPRILLEAGLEDAARDELDRLFLRARGLEDRLALAQLYADTGDFHRPQRLVVDAYQEPLARGPVSHQLELWWHAWPAPFGLEVGQAQQGAVAPELVYAVMREESGYRPTVVSVSGARGLLQLMPETAERVARGNGLGIFSIEDLFLPDVNIRLGTAYLAELLARFEGRTDAAVASYNAGPQAVARWLREQPGEDDEWVEAIPYDQTRQYVKRVMRSVHAYRVLY